jgi:hypothetical protein
VVDDDVLGHEGDETFGVVHVNDEGPDPADQAPT